MISTVWLVSGTAFAALVAFLQLSVLPGIVVLLWLRRHGTAPGVISAALLTFTISLVFTFQCLLLLHRLGWHARTAWLLLAFAETLLWIWLGRRRSAVKYPPIAGSGIAAWPLSGMAAFGAWAIGVALVGSALVSHWPAAFQDWDAVINWNRWALDWYQGIWPQLTWNYPQLLPASWSLFYVLQSSAETEVFIRAWLGLFPLATALLFLDMYLHWRRAAPLWAGAVLLLLLLGPYAQLLDSGYVDLPLAFFTLLTGHWVLLAKQYPQQPQWLLFAALAAAAAVLTKQGGLLAAGILLLGCYQCRAVPRYMLAAVMLLLASVLPWNLLHAIDGSGDSITGYVTAGIYGAETLPERLLRALTQTLPALLLPGSSGFGVVGIFSICGVALVYGCTDQRGRFCAGIGVLYLLAWAGFFSYDGRNLLPALPWLLLATAIGIDKSVGALMNRLRPPGLRDPANTTVAIGTRLARVAPRSALPFAVLVLIAAAAVPSDAAWWDRLTARARLESGDAAFNRQMLDFVATGEAVDKIYTTYAQVASISSLRPYLYRDFGTSHRQPAALEAIRAGKPLCDILATFPEPHTITHMLLYLSVYPAIIERALAAGSLQIELQTPEQRLMRVNCSYRSSTAP